MTERSDCSNIMSMSCLRHSTLISLRFFAKLGIDKACPKCVHTFIWPGPPRCGLLKGYRYWSGDITPTENPYEAGLGFAVKLNKGNFIGRDALLKIKDEGIAHRLCTLTFGGEPGVIYGGEAVYSNGQVVGRVRSGGYGYTIGKNIGLSYLPIELAELDTAVEIDVFGERIPAEVAPDTLYDPKNQRLRA